jgi:hypothetical protein
VRTKQLVRFVFIWVVALGAYSPAAFSQWTSVGDGIDYQAFSAAGPNNLFVARMTRSNTNTTIDTTIAYDTMAGAMEIVRNQAARQDDAITWWGGSWGARNDVVVAINGGFYNMTTGVIEGGQILSGWHAHWFPDKGAFSGFAWKTDRTAFHGECVDYTAAKVYVKFVANGASQAIDGINRDPGTSDLVIFTPQYDNQTPSGTRTEVLVEMSRPNLTTAGSGYSSGVIREVRLSTGSTWIPFDHLVLSAAGSEGTTLRNNSTVGAEVRIFQELVESNEPDVQGNYACQTATGVNWANVFAAINSNYHFLENGVVRVPDAVTHPGYLGYVNLNPRTAICWNSSYVFFVVCDGRSTQSVGMSCETLGNWARTTLGATDGVNLDGGGSSTMVVNGVVKNVVSDGSERAVCNGVMMVNVKPKVVSTVFSAGQTVTVSSAANIRLGPGVNYGIYSSASAGTQGTVASHQLNGVYAKGYYWWKCNFSGTVGWIAESLLVVPSSAPSITQQPANQSVTAGGTASFSIVASGSNPLSYQWQKNAVKLNDGGHYAGCTTTALTVSGVDSNDVASYRCVVTNAYGSATSSPAALTLAAGCSTPVLLNSSFEGPTNAPGISTNWVGYQRAPNPSTVWSIQTASPPAGGGSQYQQIANTSGTGGGGVRQDISGCVIGATYQVSGWMRGNSANATCTVKVSPSASTSWSTATDLNPPQTCSTNDWVSFSGTVVATGTSMTLWLDGQTGGTGLNKAECFDAVTVACVAPPPPPTITQHPSSATNCAGTTTAFSVTATGSGNTYQWQKSGVDQANGGHYSGCTTPTLTIANLDSADAANYRCRVSNASGSTNSNAAGLALKAATMITQQPASAAVAMGETTNLSVAATGSDTLTYQWQKNQTNINNGGHYSDCTTATLTISSATTNDAANYRCLVTGGCGSVLSSEATVTSVTPPAPPHFDSVAVVGPNQVKLVVSGEAGTTVTIRCSSDLASWVVLTNVVNMSGTVQFTDTTASNVVQRFYRATSP